MGGGWSGGSQGLGRSQGGWGGGRQPLGPSAPPRSCPARTLRDQHVGQDGEAGPGQGAGQGRAVAKEPEQEGGDGWARRSTAPKKNLEEEDVSIPQYETGEEEAAGGVQS